MVLNLIIGEGKMRSLPTAGKSEIEELTWAQARDMVKSVNPELYQIIEEWNPSEDYKLYKVPYKYGDKIIHEGMLNIPGSNGQLAPLHSGRTSPGLKEALSYSSVPLGLLIKNGQEVYIENDDKILPVAFFNPGVILGLWEALEEDENSFATKGVFNVTAGARSCFLLPKVAEAGSFERLRKHYGVRLPMPRKLADHSPIFAQIAKHKNFEEDWQHEILFFSGKWLERDDKNPGWLKFHHHLLEKAWALSAYNRNMLAMNWIWQKFAENLSEKGLKPSTYHIDTLKQLVTIGVGAAPGFRPTHMDVPGFKASVDAEVAGPIQGIQRVYLEDYGLKTYVPTIMVPHHFGPDDSCQAVYYSLQTPTVMESSPKARSPVSLMTEIRELKALVEVFLEDALEGHLPIAGTPIDWLVNNVNFDFFHSEKDAYDEIRSSADMPKEDPSLMKYYDVDKKRKFAESCSFVRGCVRLSKIR